MTLLAVSHAPGTPLAGIPLAGSGLAAAAKAGAPRLPLVLPKLHLHVPTAVLVTAGVVATVLLVVVVGVLAVEQRHSDPIDRLAVRRRWDWRGVRSYRGRPRNTDVTPGFSVVVGRPVRRGIMASRLDRRVVGAGHENCTLLMGGARVGKSTSYVIPAVADAPGPCIVTSNKRDVVDATRLLREEHGGTIWVFDPQRVVSAEPAPWWWNPLRRVTTVQAATELAQIWIDTSKVSGAVPDAYFEPAGTQLLAGLLFAAALARLPVSRVFWWLTDPSVALEAVEILHPAARHDRSRDGDATAADGMTGGGGVTGADGVTVEGLERREVYEATAAAVNAVTQQPDKQRAGVFGTAMKAVDWLQSPQLRAWVEDPDGTRPEFDPVHFATSRDTLYSLSKEGSAVLRPLITALTADVLLSADETASSMRGGRLAVPLVAALDECGNVCPWRQLPAMFSFFGSRGIPLLAVFQSPAQMRMTFGPEPAQALLSAANVRITMGGVEDPAHLGNLERLFGTVRVKERTRNRGRGQASTSTSWRDRQALTVDQLASMRHNRAAVTLAACSPMLVQPTAWTANRDLAPRVQASIARYGAAATIPGAAGPVPVA